MPRASDADGDLVDELLGQVVDAGALEERQRRVAAHEAGARDDVDTGLGGQGFVVVDVPPVADTGRVDEGATAVLVELAELGTVSSYRCSGDFHQRESARRRACRSRCARGSRRPRGLLGRDRTQDGVHVWHGAHLRVSRSRGLSTSIRWMASLLSPSARGGGTKVVSTWVYAMSRCGRPLATPIALLDSRIAVTVARVDEGGHVSRARDVGQEGHVIKCPPGLERSG